VAHRETKCDFSIEKEKKKKKGGGGGDAGFTPKKRVGNFITRLPGPPTEKNVWRTGRKERGTRALGSPRRSKQILGGKGRAVTPGPRGAELGAGGEGSV